MNTSFFGELLQTITERGRALLDRAGARREAVEARSESLVELCEDLLSRRPCPGRRRFRASVLVVVQPRLPGAAADRLVDAGDRAGEDHPLRGGAPHSRLGGSAPAHRSARPAMLRLLPPGAGRRSVDLR